MNIFSAFVNLDLLTVGVSIAITGILGFVVYFNNSKSITNKTFLYFAVAAIFWGTVNYLNYQFSSAVVVLWLLRLVIFFAVWYSFFLFQFFYVFPKEKVIFPQWYKFYLIPIVIITSVNNLTPLVFPSIAELAPVGQVSKTVVAPGIYLFVAVIVGLIGSAIFLLIKKMRKAEGLEKSQYKFIILGAFFTFSLHIIFNLILPGIFLNVRFIPFGAIFTFPLAVFTSYAIIKHRLFNIRIVGTVVLVFALSIVSFVEVALADSLLLIIYRIAILIFVLIFGILLIKGVLREVKQREEIEKLNKEIERAYEVEKKAKEDVSRAYDVERRANEELQNLDKVKNQFLLTTQHDLRKPLTSVKWFLDMLVKGVLGRQTKKTLEGAGKVQLSVEESIEEVNDFLDMAQFQMGKAGIVLKPGVDVLPILDRIITKLKPRADENGVALTFEKTLDNQGKSVPVLIDADAIKLKAALSNVVDNSIKYAPKGKVDMSIALTNGDKSVLITVKDNGIGIPKDKVKSIFENMFERTEDAKRTTSMGKGIGLPLSTQIIRDHKGKIWAESEGEGKGSTFFVELPVSSGIPAPVANSSAPVILNSVAVPVATPVVAPVATPAPVVAPVVTVPAPKVSTPDTLVPTKPAAKPRKTHKVKK